jgi:hypothetical protein
MSSKEKTLKEQYRCWLIGDVDDKHAQSKALFSSVLEIW